MHSELHHVQERHEVEYHAMRRKLRLEPPLNELIDQVGRQSTNVNETNVVQYLRLQRSKRQTPKGPFANTSFVVTPSSSGAAGKRPPRFAVQNFPRCFPGGTTPQPTPPPSTPEIEHIVLLGVVNDGLHFRITLRRMDNAKRYLIQTDSHHFFASRTRNFDAVVLRGHTRSKRYRFRSAAENAAGRSEWSKWTPRRYP